MARAVPDPKFGPLAEGLVEAFGQEMGASRRVPEGLLLRTEDGFVYAFVERGATLDTESAQRWTEETGSDARRLVVLSPDRLDPDAGRALARARATIVDGDRFRTLARGLGLGEYLGEPPSAEELPPEGPQLPSARRLDETMERARAWSNWGVPALALRFYRRASELKPEFLPARIGAARALLDLGLVDEADRAFAEIERQEPDNLDARIGRAAALGARGRLEEEVATYRALLNEDPSRVAVAVQLVATLVDHHRWSEAKPEIERLLRRAPEDARLRYLHALALERTGDPGRALEARAAARRLGLTETAERGLLEHLGLPVPPAEPSAAPAASARGDSADAGAPRDRPSVGADVPAPEPVRPARRRRRSRRNAK
jgi:tetratricopeptide (TPR) repeat protein